LRCLPHQWCTGYPCWPGRKKKLIIIKLRFCNLRRSIRATREEKKYFCHVDFNLDASFKLEMSRIKLKHIDFNLDVCIFRSSVSKQTLRASTVVVRHCHQWLHWRF
jgi:hypothetical protein